MKRTLGLIIVALLTVGLVGAYTMAWFSDTETSNDNYWKAGTLNLKVNDIDGANTVVFAVTNANPGESGTGTWTLKNVGTVAGDITLSGIAVRNKENYDAATDEAELYHATTNPDGDLDTSDLNGGGELGANLDVVLFVDNGGTTGIANNGILDGDEATIYAGKLDSIAASYAPTLPLVGGGTTYISMTWSVATTVGNTIIGDSAELDMTFVLTQTP